MTSRLLSALSFKVVAGRGICHVPVLLDNVVKYLKNRNVIIDMTFGGGGHSKALLKSSDSTIIVCVDRDPSAYQAAQALAADFPDRVLPFLGKFSELPQMLKKIHINKVDGILFDFGFSSGQMDAAERGFSLSKSGPLDMRMNPDSDTPTAYDVLQYAEEQDLYKIFKIYGEEKNSRKLARAIVERRYSFSPLKTTKDLADFVGSFGQTRTDKLGRPSHPATKIFQALRIFVNDELNEIDYGMTLAKHFLKIGGILVAISFHSLEDTIVKRHLTENILENSANILPLRYASHIPCAEQDLQKEPCWSMLTKHVVTPTDEEVESNPRSRSAKLRAAVKLC